MERLGDDSEHVYCEYEQNYLNGKLKTVTAYFGDDSFLVVGSAAAAAGSTVESVETVPVADPPCETMLVASYSDLYDDHK